MSGEGVVKRFKSEIRAAKPEYRKSKGTTEERRKSAKPYRVIQVAGRR